MIRIDEAYYVADFSTDKGSAAYIVCLYYIEPQKKHVHVTLFCMSESSAEDLSTIREVLNKRENDIEIIKSLLKKYFGDDINVHGIRKMR